MRFAWVLVLATACVDGSSQATGPATLSVNGGTSMQVSAYASLTNASYLIGPSGTTGFEPWQVVLLVAPTGTSCATGLGNGSLEDDASGWLATIDIAVPYMQGDDAAALEDLQAGSMPIADFGSLEPVAQPEASLQVFDTGDEGVMSAGTLTITGFDDTGIEGTFEATGTGAATRAAGTFIATRCDF
ncbi:MAG TPA: hypothetical protein VGF94_20700 [Kofleriaceae bacterium]|jgi:hypothetical protein